MESMLDNDLDILTMDPNIAGSTFWSAPAGTQALRGANPVLQATAVPAPAAAGAGFGASAAAAATLVQPKQQQQTMTFPMIAPKSDEKSDLAPSLTTPVPAAAAASSSTVLPYPATVASLSRAPLTDAQIMQLLSQYQLNLTSSIEVQTRIRDVIENYKFARNQELKDARPLSRQETSELIRRGVSKDFLKRRNQDRSVVRQRFVLAEAKFKYLINLLDTLKSTSDGNPIIIPSSLAASPGNAVNCAQYHDACQRYGHIGLDTEFYVNPLTLASTTAASVGLAPAAAAATSSTTMHRTTLPQTQHVLDCSQYCIKTMLLRNFGIENPSKKQISFPSSVTLCFHDDKSWRLIDYKSLEISFASKRDSRFAIQHILVIDMTRQPDRILNPLLDRENDNSVVVEYQPSDIRNRSAAAASLARAVDALNFTDNDQFELRMLFDVRQLTNQPDLTKSHGHFQADQEKDAIYFVPPGSQRRFKVYPAFILDQFGSPIFDFEPYRRKTLPLTPLYQETIALLSKQGFVGTSTRKPLMLARADPRLKYRHKRVVECTIAWKPYDATFVNKRSQIVASIMRNMQQSAPATRLERERLYNRSLAYQRLFFNDKNAY